MSDGGRGPNGERPQHPGLIACSCGCGLFIHEFGQFEELREENLALKHRIGRLEVERKRLLRDADCQLPNDPNYEKAVAVLEYWRDRCLPGAKQVKAGPRVRLVLALLKGEDGFTVQELKRCVDGYAAFPYVVSGVGRRPEGQKGQRRVAAELVFRNLEMIDQGFRLADRADAAKVKMPASDDGPAPVVPVEDLGRLGNAALQYVTENNWHVFPCLAGGKHPATRRGLLAAKTGQQGKIAVRWFWSRCPNANVAVRTGRESGIVVLDVDDDKGGLESLHALEKRHGPLPDTLTVKTPSGGQHYYFLHPGREIRNTQGVPGPGMDVRGDGGYVLAPPSVLASGGRYEVDDELDIAPLPGWLEWLLVERQIRQSVRIDPREWERILRNGVRQGERNGQLLRVAGHLWSKGLPPGEVLGWVKLANRSTCQPPLDEDEVERIVRSVQSMRARQAKAGVQQAH